MSPCIQKKFLCLCAHTQTRHIISGGAYRCRARGYTLYIRNASRIDCKATAPKPSNVTECPPSRTECDFMTRVYGETDSRCDTLSRQLWCDDE